jgi:hypothetical protein
LPDLDKIRATFTKWLAVERHQMVSRGRVCPGQSPSQRYKSACEPKFLRAVNADEIAHAFLRVHRHPIKVKGSGSFEWTPPGGTTQDRLVFADAALKQFGGERIQIRFDNLKIFPPRVFAFHRHEYDDHGETHTTWKLICCSGELGSVPNLLSPDAIVEGEDASQALRESIANSRRLDRDTKRSRDVQAEQVAEDQLAREQGIDRVGRTYVLKTRDVVARRQANAARADRDEKVMAELDKLVSPEDREVYLKGRRQ